MQNNDSVHLSVVSPVYGCGKSLAELVDRIRQTADSFENKPFEIILVDDASPDNAWAVIESLSKEYPFVRGLRLSRNFGQHAAIQAGLASAKGEWIVVMDCDLQDRPEEIPLLYQKALEGFDLVMARRSDRKDRRFKQWASSRFYKVLSYLTETDIDPAVANFGIYHRRVVDAILSMGDYVRFFPSMASWVGFRRTAIEVDHGVRVAGKSAYGFSKLMRLGINVILSFSDRPLRLVVKFGFLITFAVLLAALVVFVRFFRGEIDVMGYTSLILSVWFLGGLMISILGLTGLYVGKSFDQVKDRPIFIVAESTDDED